MENNDLIKPDFFVAGLTGSGKDTVTNYIKQYFHYNKMRIARTIKTIICEKNDVTFDELEILKREKPEFREKHHEESDYLKIEATLTRTKQIANRTSMDYESMKDKEEPIVVCDVRIMEEAEILFQHNSYGIFLSRTTGEYKNAAHFTEKNMFLNGDLKSLISRFGEQCIIVLNGGVYDLEDLKTAVSEESGDPIFIEFEGDPTGEDLIDNLDFVITNIIEKENA